MNRVVEIVLLAVIVLVLDFAFLGLMRNYFDNQIRVITGAGIKMNILAAILCYMVIIGCIFRFGIQYEFSILDSALLGWSVYLIYELTNKALFDKWSWTTVMIDGIWGGILFAASVYLFRLARKSLQ